MRNPKLLPFSDLRDRGVLLGRRQIDRLEAEGKFPRRVPIGANRVGWVATEIDDWVSAAIARRAPESGTIAHQKETALTRDRGAAMPVA